MYIQLLNGLSKKGFFLLLVLALFALFFSNCTAEHLQMATTTSVENSGLLDVLLPAFTEKFGLKIYALAVGTARALRLAERGDVDLVLVHAPQQELEFMRRGLGVNRKTVFYNDFVIVGPPEDPAHIRNQKEVASAFRVIAESGARFISRGDGSGTHQKEEEIWQLAGFSPEGEWYIETGQGMGATLVIAAEKQGYCLVDRGTFISFEDKLGLVILYEEAASLFNPYSVIAVNPDIHPHIKYQQARLFIDWLSSPEAKAIINGFQKKGKTLFYPFDGIKPRNFLVRETPGG